MAEVRRFPIAFLPRNFAMIPARVRVYHPKKQIPFLGDPDLETRTTAGLDSLREKARIAAKS
jgi:hypothetical protein